MPVIDELVVKLGMDASKFTAGQKAAVEASKKALEEMMRGANELDRRSVALSNFFTRLKTEFVAFLGVGFGGYEFKQMITNITTMDAATGRLAYRVGLHTETVAQWANAIRLVGGNAEEAGAAIEGLSQSVQDWMRGTGTLSPAMQNFLSMAVRGGAKNIQDPAEILLGAHAYVQQTGMNPMQAAAFYRQGGLSTSMINLMLSKDFDKIIEQVRSMAGATDQSARTSQQYQESLGKLSIAFEGLERITTIFVAGPLAKMMEWLTKGIDWFSRGTASLPEGERQRVEALQGTGPRGLDAFKAWWDIATGKRTYAEVWGTGSTGGTGLIGGVDTNSTFGAYLASRGTPSTSGTTDSAMAAYMASIARIESGGNYREIGPATRTGDRAYGKYQVMGANVAEWTKQALGHSMTIQEFLASPEAQDAVFKYKFGSYIAKYGSPQEAASVWFTGRPIAQGAGASDVLGTTGAKYVQMFNQGLNNTKGDTTTNSVNIDRINIYTQATDAQGIAGDLHGAVQGNMSRFTLGSYANAGNE